MGGRKTLIWDESTASPRFYGLLPSPKPEQIRNENMTPRKRVEAVLYGDQADRVPFTIYECMVPDGEVGQQLRDEGLCIVDRQHPVVHTHTPNVTSQSQSYTEEGVTYSRTDIHTPVGDLYTHV